MTSASKAAKKRNGVEKLIDLVSPKLKDYEVIAQLNDKDGATTDKALSIVKKFIIEKQLIIFGGLAIDYALRLKGSEIYPINQRPDFDFLSPKSIDHAYELADILYTAGFESVSAIRGIHVQTMKVRTSFIVVADIGYAPQDVFDSLPTIDYQGMKIIHPDYQRMDIHLAFCFPFSNPPREDVFHRWKKDLKRFNILENYYPIVSDLKTLDTNTMIKRVITKFPIDLIGEPTNLKVALHGFAAYAIMYEAVQTLLENFGSKIVLSVCPLHIEFIDTHTIAVEQPIEANLTFASPWISEISQKVKYDKKFAPYMDVFPSSFQFGNAIILDTSNRLLATNIYQILHTKMKNKKTMYTYIVSPQYLLLWFLYKAHTSKQYKDTYRKFYLETLKIIETAEILLSEEYDSTITSEAHKTLLDVFALSPFSPTINTLGDTNHDLAYIIKIASTIQRCKDLTPPKSLNLPDNILYLLTGLPQNYYPSSSQIKPSISYTSNPSFNRSGQEIISVEVALDN